MSHTETILVVDDDREIVAVIRDYLQQDSFTVFTAYDGETALHMIRRERPSLVVLDIMLPGRDGRDLTRIIRQDKTLMHTPIILLTARVEDADKIVGLELGADDYVTKPFNPRELVARIRTVLRRVQKSPTNRTDTVLRCGALTLSTATREAAVDGQAVKLTPTEFRLLLTLIAQPNFVFTRAELVEKAFGYDYELEDRALDNHIRNLRKKIEPDPNQPIYIQTVYGVGYRLAGEES